MKTAYCPACDDVVEVAEGRCWECCAVLGYPVLSEDEARGLTPNLSSGVGADGRNRGLAPRPSSLSTDTREAA